MLVVLEPHELLLASIEAGMRWSSAESHSKRDRGGVGNSVEKHVAGVCGEVAVAKWTGRYWTAGKRAAGDVGGLEVRTRRGDPRDESQEMIVQPYDERKRPDAPFVLVVGRGREWRIVGWTTPRRARSMVEYGGAKVADPGDRGAPAIFVPQGALLPIDEFRAPDVPALAEAEA